MLLAGTKLHESYLKNDATKNVGNESDEQNGKSNEDQIMPKMEMFMADTITDCSIFMSGRIKVGDFTQFFQRKCNKSDVLSHQRRIFARIPDVFMSSRNSRLKSADP